ncbi:MAG TPA: dimethyl sulfoxide reductase [Pasteurellaceae bacterium]|nr:dimethyl sulfoxide reductase [Pasteurellaceae bacterium]
MNAGLHEWPLIIFTVLAQSAVGAFLLMTALLWQTESIPYRQSVHKRMLVWLFLLGIGFIASILHLGSPLRAFNAFNRIGQSMLSNEIVSGIAFFTFAGLYWLLSVLNKMPRGLEKTGLILTALLGLIFMYMMNQVYHIRTVPTWNSSLTSWSFYLTVLIGGSALGYVLWNHQQAPHTLSKVRQLLIVGIALAAVIAVYQAFMLGQIQSSVQQAAALVPDYAFMTVMRLLCLAIGAALLFRNNAMLSLLSVVLILGAEMIGRTLFYGMHMTVGMAVNS